MLLGDFFTIKDLQVSGPDVSVAITINAKHKIFDGHFPGQPVVPGVCMMQMVKEIMEHVTGRKTILAKAHEMKFLVVIDPSRNNNIRATLKYSQEEDGKINVTATLLHEETIHFKFKGQLDSL